jgi:hypothetical protein
MRRALLAFFVSCTPAPVVTQAPPPVVAASEPPPRADDCHRDIPDCAAACALRETGHPEHLDWFDRRCAAVVLGRNPDKAVGYSPPSPPPLPPEDNGALRSNDLESNPYR